jgi:hypothetical protein
MSRICVDLSDVDEEYFRTMCCREGESTTIALTRIVVCEIKNKRLQVDLRDGGNRT